MKEAGTLRIAGGWMLRGLSTAAMLTGLWLTWLKVSGQVSSVTGCGGAGGCAEVLGGRWSEWMGMPVALLAAVVHGVVLAFSLPGLRQNPAFPADRILAGAALLLAGGAVYFLTILYLVERQHCPWCLAMHGAGLAVAVMVLKGNPWPNGLKPVAWAAGGLAVLVLGQIWGPQPQTYLVTGSADASAAPAAGAREWSYLDGQLKVIPGTAPLLGTPLAKVVLVEFFDYTCGSCRDLAGDLKELNKKWPDHFAVVVLPAPLNRSCNAFLKPEVKDHAGACELAKLALAVWRAKPEAFPEFHDYLFTLPLPVSLSQLAAARQRAGAVAGEEMIGKALEDPWVAQRLQDNLAVYARLTTQSVVMPKLLLPPSQVMHGTAPDAAEFVRVMEAQFRLRK